ncbi:MAG: XRE family transcriptional regulator [Spirochaetota bacterium]
MNKKYIGESFDDFLKKEDILEDVTDTAVKRVLAFQIQKAMEQQSLTKVEMAHRMATSRAALDRLLEPDNDSVTLETLKKAAAVVGRKIKLELV